MKRELGDVVTSALISVGITDSRVSKWLGKPCACPIYRERLNRLSRWARRTLTGKTDQAQEQLEELIDED
jgi:hypothetical protein